MTDLRSEWEGETESKKRARVTELGGRAAIVEEGRNKLEKEIPNQTSPGGYNWGRVLVSLYFFINPSFCDNQAKKRIRKKKLFLLNFMAKT